MPAASNKTESKPSSEAVDPVKQFLNLVDKKVRNIEKRKSKLDAVRSKQAAGETLEKEQKEAIKHYDSVIVNLEFARELQKNFSSVAADIEKQQKKQGKREKQEKAANELKRMVDVLLVQSTLDSLGSENVRQHFKTGKHGAVVLTEDNLTSLDELFQLISPTRDGEENFATSLTTAGEHMISLLEGRDRPVAGSTYKELLELIHLIDGCGYFERVRETEEASAEPAEEKEEEKEEQETPAPVAPTPTTPTDTFNDVHEADLQNNATVQQSASDLEESSLSHSQVAPSVVTQEAPNSSFFTQTTTSTTPAAFQPPQTQAPPPQPIPPAKTRPLPEIISSVRGTFSFLQDSEIEDSPHIDPAVVAAQPMMRPPSVNSQPPQTSLLPAGFPAPPMVDQSCDSESQDPLSLSQQSLTQSNLDFSGASQSFAQAGLSHSQNLSGGVVADALFQASVEDSAAAPSQQHSSHGMMGQGRGTGEPSAQFDLPPSIPMPPSQSQQDVSQLAGQEKKFQLNASATEFQSRSMYSQMPPTLPNLSSQPPPTQPQQPQPQLPTQTPTPTPTQPPAQPPHQASNPTESRPLPASATQPTVSPLEDSHEVVVVVVAIVEVSVEAVVATTMVMPCRMASTADPRMATVALATEEVPPSKASHPAVTIGQTVTKVTTPTALVDLPPSRSVVVLAGLDFPVVATAAVLEVCVVEHPGVDLPVELVVTGVASTAPATSDLELLNFDHHLGNQPTCARVTS